MMKKVYFQLAAMNIGGVEKSWLNLIDTLPKDEYEIHLGLIKPYGGYMEYIPTNITIHNVDCYNEIKSELNDPPQFVLKNKLIKGELICFIILFVLYLQCKITNNRYYLYKYLTRNVPVEDEIYDEAYAYAGPSQMTDFYVCEKIQAKEKYGWIHFDVTKFGIDKGMTRKLYKSYKKIYVVSETAKEKFDSLFPEFKDKTEVRYNVVSKDQVVRLAEEGDTFTDNYSGRRILTVGRLTSEKGQNVAIEALKILIDKGIEAKWYFVGDGNIRKECEERAESLGISQNVCFLGTQTNPYGYMRDCDIYMQPSRHEGFCITLAEAKCFNNPIVATNFTGAEEQLKTVSNSVVTGMSAEEIAKVLEKFL